MQNPCANPKGACVSTRSYCPSSPPPFTRSKWLLCKGLSEVPCHVANETMNRHLRDAATDDRIHSLSHCAEWWFVKTREIQLRFGRGQRVDGKLGRHQREQAWHGRRLPFEQQSSGGGRHDIKDLLLDVFDGNLDIGLNPNTGNVDVQFSSDRLRSVSGSLRRRLEHGDCVLPQCIADALVGMVHVVVAANLTPFTHQRGSVRIDRLFSQTNGLKTVPYCDRRCAWITGKPELCGTRA